MSDKKEKKEKKSDGKTKWKCKKHKAKKHDVFINYRVRTEKDLATKIFYALSSETKEDGKAYKPFLDALCLNDGEDWEAGFLNGLEHAAVILMLISEDGIKGIEGAHERQDNVLLEYEYALEKAEKNKVVLLPLHIGKNVDGGLYKAFGAFGVSQYSENKHASAKSKGKSVRGTMEALFKIQGLRTNPDSFSDKMKEITDKITEALKKFSRMGEAKSEETYNDKYVSDWTIKDVQAYLKEGGLEEYAAKFKENAIDGSMLLKLDEKTISEELGVSKKLHVMKLVSYIEEQKEAEKKAEEDGEFDDDDDDGEEDGEGEGDGEGGEGGDEEGGEGGGGDEEES